MMNWKPAVFAVAVLCVLSGCAARPPDPLLARRRAYERLLSFVEPGMTRRQLYALLPPARPPSAKPPALSSICGTAEYTPLTEHHILDRDFSLTVQYQVARLNEYPLPPYAPGRRHNPSFDDLMRGRIPIPPAVPSRQNPDDELLMPPTLCGPGLSSYTFPAFTGIYGLSLPKTEKAKTR